MRNTIDRTLGSFERAAARTYAAAPFHAAVSMLLDGDLDSRQIRETLARVAGQSAQLSSYVVADRLAACDAAPELVVVEGADEEHDVARAVDELLSDRPHERSAHPVRARLLRHAGRTSLVLAAPHFLVDGVSLAQVAFSVLAGEAGEPMVDAPAIETRFPAPFRGVRVLPKLAKYLAGEMAAERRLKAARAVAVSTPTPRDGTTRHVVRSLDARAVGDLLAGCKERGSGLYGILAAAALRVCLDQLRTQPSGVLGLLAFRDLRKRVDPVYGPEEVGACFAMVRHLVEIMDEDDDWKVAADVSRIIATSGRRGDAFLANLIAPHLLAVALPRRMRLADVAVSLPLVPWPRRPFVSRVRRFAGFVSASPLAPPLSIVAARSPAGLSLSFVYLDSVLEPSAANDLADAVVNRLSRAITSDRDETDHE
jgi:hypothetical protein